VSDTLSNMDAVRAHAAELREAAEHRRRVAANRALAMRSWDYSNLCIDVVVAPLSVLVNGLGLMLAIGVATRPGGPGVAAVVVVVAVVMGYRSPESSGSSARAGPKPSTLFQAC